MAAADGSLASAVARGGVTRRVAAKSTAALVELRKSGSIGRSPARHAILFREIVEDLLFGRFFDLAHYRYGLIDIFLSATRDEDVRPLRDFDVHRHVFCLQRTGDRL